MNRDESYIDPDMEKAFQVLEGLGVPSERARTVPNGIMVLDQRYAREIQELKTKIDLQPPDTIEWLTEQANRLGDSVEGDIVRQAIHIVKFAYGCRLHEMPWPESNLVRRKEDMSSTGVLMVGLDSDNDVGIMITKGQTADDFESAEVEFCCPGSGGGRSPHTRKALIALMVAMEQDNLENPQG